ncbi:MAG: sporulation protein YqfD [Oscillospiraceae bacterium]|nr:sporulation protein YqfD [Oscillospiraceae bacterium]
MSSYIEFTAFGAYCGDFISELVASEYDVWDVTAADGLHTVKTAPANYLSIARTARKYRVKTRVTDRAGAYFLLKRYRRRVGIPLGLLAFFAIIVMMSNHVWVIKISGNSGVGNWQILERLAESGIRPGVHVESVNANLAELELMLAIEELAWVSIEPNGNVINVKISERIKEDGKVKIPLDTDCNVISDKSGQLIKAQVYRGELLYEVGSGVNAGDVIVSGVVVDTQGKQSYVHADASLIVEVVDVVDFYQPYTTFRRAKNGQFVRNNSIVFLGMRFGGERQINKYADHVEYSENVRIPQVFGFPLPLRVLEQDYTFYERVEVTESPADTFVMLGQSIELYEKNFLKGTDGADAVIVDKQVEYFPDENGIGALVRYVYQAEAAVQKEFAYNPYG